MGFKGPLALFAKLLVTNTTINLSNNRLQTAFVVTDFRVTLCVCFKKCVCVVGFSETLHDFGR